MKIKDFNIDEYIEILKNNDLIDDNNCKVIYDEKMLIDKTKKLNKYLTDLVIEDVRKKDTISKVTEKLYEFLFITEKDSWPRKGINLGLNRMNSLLSILGNPQENLQIIHIGGTNGKGSTCAFIQSILMESGYNVGLFTSPSIIAENEGIRINKKFIPFEKAYTMLVKIKELWISKFGIDDFPSYFEIFTALSILYFNEEKVDFAIYEVGLGGRLDATNIFKRKLLSIITSISADHLGIIGNDIEEIAYEKAGIIQEKDNVILYPIEDKLINIVRNVVNEKNAKLEILEKKDIHINKLNIYNTIFSFKDHKDLIINMIGEHQVFNASMGIMAIENMNKRKIINISEDILRKGLLSAIWPGRLEWISKSPKVLIDGAHNQDSVNSLVKYLRKQEYNNIRILMGVLKDKDYNNIFKELSSLRGIFYLTEVPFEERKMTIEDMRDCLSYYTNNIQIDRNPIKALDKLIKDMEENDLVVITGSLYLISELRNYILEKNLFR